MGATCTQLQATVDDSQHRQLTLWLDNYQSITEAKPLLQTRIPDLNFVERLEIIGSARTAKLIEFVSGHSESDALLFLPEEGIAFMGDLLCVDYHPWLPFGNQEKFLHALETI